MLPECIPSLFSMRLGCCRSANRCKTATNANAGAIEAKLWHRRLANSRRRIQPRRRFYVRSRSLIIFGCLMLSVARGQQGSASEGIENDLDHAVKVSDDALWHLELDGS